MGILAELRTSFYKYINNQSDASEAEAFLMHLQSGRDKDELIQLIEECFDSPIAEHLLTKPEILAVLDDTYAEILNKIGQDTVKPNQIKLWQKIAIAASLSMVVGLGLYFYKSFDSGKGAIAVNQDVAPGKNAATLTLANGKKINLSDAVKGELAQESGISITKTEDGQVVYQMAGSASAASAEESKNLKFNTLSTARGEQYQVILPDGTKVWLNAASSLKFPSTFAHAASRKVELSGEAYFEVTKDKSHPFKVTSEGQEVEVLGTHFDISSYADEELTKTTLLEGSVRVALDSRARTLTSKKILKPNEQSNLVRGSQTLQVKTVDAEAAVAWKNGLFQFDNADIKTVMSQLSRWYDIDVEFSGAIPKETFSGKVYRNMSLAKVLDVLSFSQVNFKIEGRKMIIHPPENK